MIPFDDREIRIGGGYSWNKIIFASSNGPFWCIPMENVSWGKLEVDGIFINVLF